MKEILCILSSVVLLILSGCRQADERLEKDFVSPPENFHTGAYRYRMNNHITKEGIVNNLKAMKKAGINRVLPGSDIVSGNAFGPVRVFSVKSNGEKNTFPKAVFFRRQPMPYKSRTYNEDYKIKL